MKTSFQNKTYLAVLIITIVLFFTNVVFSNNADLNDPWYNDIPNNHWAYQDIHVLWEENITDGFVIRDKYFPENDYSLFRPKDNCSISQFSMMLFKVFRLKPHFPNYPTFLDVPEDFLLYNNKPAYGIIESIHKEGIISNAGNYFYPDRDITREEAAVLLIRALGLQEYASSLSISESISILSVFDDWREISEKNLKEMAVAVKFKILRGYGFENRTLKPSRVLIREEAAVVIFRSCLIKIEAKPDSISPNGDGIDDYTTFYLYTLKNRNISSLNLEIHNYLGTETFASFKFDIDNGDSIPEHIVWNGSRTNGIMLDPGVYYYSGYIKDLHGNTFRSTMKPIVIHYPDLNGYLFPRYTQPGGNIVIHATTSGCATSVEAVVDESERFFLQRINPINSFVPSEWSASFTIDKKTPDGDYPVMLYAHYLNTTRNIELEYTIQEHLSLHGDVKPKVLKSGEALSVLAESSPNIISVKALFPDGTIKTMKSIGNSMWSIEYRTPLHGEDGDYPIHLLGRSLNNEIWTEVNYCIIGNMFSNVKVFLSG